MRRFHWILMFLLLSVGCSAGVNFPTNPQPSSSFPNPTSDRTILAYGSIQFDPETLTATFIPDRYAEAHWNVTPMLQPPNCDDCITIEVLEFKPAQKYIKLKITLKNPTSLTAYDVRGIAIVPSKDVRLLNADGWTDLYVSRNPFKAFATDQPERTIDPYTHHARVYEFTFPLLSQLVTGTQLVVDASWPSHCKEAYAFDNVQQSGFIDGNTSSADFSVTLTPQDWQGDISNVLIDLSAIGGSIEPMVQNGNDYTFSYQASVVVPEATFANIWVDVVDSVAPVHAYWRFEIGVVKDDPSLPVVEGINAAPGEVFVKLTWEEINDPDVAGVNIYRREKGYEYEFSEPLTPTPLTSAQFNDTDVIRNHMYFYVLRTVSTTGSLSPISTETGAKPWEWDSEIQVSDVDLYLSRAPRVAVGPDKRVRVTWYDDRPFHHYFDYYDETHSPDLAIFDENPGFSPGDGARDLLVNFSNINYMVTAGNFGMEGGDIAVYHFDDDLVKTGPFHFGWEIPLTWPRNACFDLEGNLWVAFSDRPNGGNPLFVYVTSLSPQDVLSDPVLISPEGVHASQMAGLACDNNNELHCAFMMAIGDPPYVRPLFYTRTIDGVWQEPEQVNLLPDGYTQNWQRLDVTPNGIPYVVYATIAGGGFPFISLQWRDEAGWSNPMSIFPDATTCSSLALEIDDDGNINVFEAAYSYEQISFRRGYNGSWSDVYKVSQSYIPGTLGIMSFQISADSSPSGAISLAWERAESDIYVRKMKE